MEKHLLFELILIPILLTLGVYLKIKEKKFALNLLLVMMATLSRKTFLELVGPSHFIMQIGVVLGAYILFALLIEIAFKFLAKPPKA